MHGRSCSCLLAILAVMLVTASPLRPSLSAQAANHSTTVPFKQAPLAPQIVARISRDEPPVRPVSPFPVGPPGRLPIVPRTIGLPQIARAAGTIFSGTVVSIAPVTQPDGGSLESVAITFRVEHSLRGAKTGQLLTISQWRGLWTNGQRYHPGERVLLFLYPQSQLGLTSSVAGSIGRFNIDARGRVRLSEPQVAAFRNDPMLGGKRLVHFGDFALSMQQAGEAGGLRP